MALKLEWFTPNSSQLCVCLIKIQIPKGDSESLTGPEWSHDHLPLFQEEWRAGGGQTPKQLTVPRGAHGME